MVANCLKLVFVMLDANLERSLMSIVYDEKLKDGNKKVQGLPEKPRKNGCRAKRR